jgi:parvulin-like peptidyl-prolyl isomerase
VAGERGWTAAETFPPGIAEAIRRTPLGQVGGPAQGREGFYLVRVEGKRGGGIAAFAQVKERVQHVLLQEKRLTRLKLWVEEEKKAAKVRVIEASS